MACIKQYPMPLYYDPQLVEHTYEVDEEYLDKLRQSASTADKDAAAKDAECKTMACVSVSGNWPSQGGDACRELNAAYAEIESACIDKHKDQCKQYFQACLSIGNSILEAYVPEASNDCHPVGTFARECRDAWTSGRVPPNNWWLGPSAGRSAGEFPTAISSQRPYKKTPRVAATDGWNGTPEDPALTSLKDPDAANDPTKAVGAVSTTRPGNPDGWVFAAEVDFEYYKSREISRCSTGEANYFKEFSYLSLHPANISRCVAISTRNYNSLLRGQQKRLNSETEKA